MTRSSTEQQSRAAAGERVRQALSRPQWRAQWKMVEQLRKKHGPGTPPASLPAWHRFGSFVDRVMKSSLRSVKGAAQGLADLIGCNQWEIQRSRQFATDYTRAEAKALQGEITWSLVVQLLTIPNGKERRAMQQACIRGRWSFAQLKNEIRAHFGRRLPRGQVGRPARRPANTREALVQLVERMTAVVRWYRGLQGEAPVSDAIAKSQAAEGCKASQLPPRLREQIEKAIRDLEALCNRLEGGIDAAVKEN